tara:strand:- start:12 stop:350 length:339 start_codon:yes stop_codon:yes gene_type:complete
MKKKLTYCFDIDNTICTTKSTKYSKSIPKEKIIRKINSLYDDGHIIKIYTARYMGRNNDQLNKAKKQGFKSTENQLKKWGLKYHNLFFGKPSADLYIDDKSVFYKKNWITML